MIWRLLRNVVQLHLLEVDRELSICRRHHVLDLELRVLDGESHFLDDPGIFATGQLALLFGPCAGDDHFATAEDEARGFGVPQSHDDSCESIRVVLCRLALPGDFLKVEFTTQIDSSDHILYLGLAALRNLHVFVLHMSSYYIYYTTNQNNEQLNYTTDIRLTYIYSLQKDHDVVCPYFFHVCL